MSSPAIVQTACACVHMCRAEFVRNTYLASSRAEPWRVLVHLLST